MRKYRNSLFVVMASALLALPFPVIGGAPLTTPTSASLAAAAGSDFVLLIGSTEGGDSFGDEPGSVGGRYRGLEFTYPAFDLPGVDPSKNGYVVLASRSVANNCNRFEINGVQIPIFRDHNNSGEWETEIFRIPTGVLKATDNRLRIAALNEQCTTGGNEVDFVVSNVVLHYRTQ